MKPRTKQFAKRFLALFLTLAMMLTLLPTIALAEDAELIKFKNMNMTVLRNGMSVASYDYESKQNDLQNGVALSLNASWVKLSFVISYSQNVSLKLYRMTDEKGNQDWQKDNPLYLESYIDRDSPPSYGADEDEEFLGEFIGYLNGVRVTDNINPLDESADFVNYQRIDEDRWMEIVWDAVKRGEGDRTGCTTMKDIYAFGFAGESYAHYRSEKDAAAGILSEDEMDMSQTDALLLEGEEDWEEPAENVELEDASAVLLSDTALFSEDDADEETIQNILLWDGTVEEENGTVFKPDYEVGRYVIVMQPTDPATAPYNSFLAFEVKESESAAETFQDINSYEQLVAIRDELACPAEPVDLLTGSFRWQYTDLALYGSHDLPFTRYYESGDAGFQHGLGYGWSTDYSAKVEFHDLYATVALPKGVRLNFALDFDGSYVESGDYALLRTMNGYALCNSQTNQIWEFNLAGKLTCLRDADGSEIICEYSDGRLARISNGAGSLELEYQGDLICSVTDSVGRRLSLSYEGEYLVAVENPDADSLRYAYDVNGYLATVENFEGQIYVRNEYDNDGRVVHQFADKIGTFDFTYDFNARHNICTGSDGYLCEIWYDEMGRITASRDASDTQFVTYDEWNRVTSRTDREGNATNFAYDAEGNVAEITYADGTYEQYRYNEARQVTWMRDRNGSESTYTYDGQTHLTSFTDGRGNTTSYTYDEKGNRISSTTALGAVSSYTYDDKGNCLTATDANGGVTSCVYDEQGRVSSVTDAEGNVTSYEYTDAGKLVKIIDANGGVQTYEVNGNGFNVASSDWLGNLTRYTYDIQSNLTSVTDPMGNVTAYAYDDRGNMIATTDANGNVTRYTYDASGRMTSMTDAKGNTWHYDYNKNGQLVSTTDPTGGVTGSTYNNVDRAISARDANGNTTLYTYDGVGNLIKTTDALGKNATNEYDASGNLIASTDRNGNRTTYTYDEENRLTRMVDAEGNETVYTYDALGRMTVVVGAMGNESSKTYDLLGRLVSARNALGYVTDYEYDALGRTTKVTYADGGFVAYTYDANGQVLTATNELGGVIGYVYDANGQLVSMTDAMGGVTAYTYDTVGNVLTVTDAMGGVTAYTYDETGNILSVTDANGNVTSYTYDALGRTTAITDPNGGVTRTEYDHNGNVIKTVDAESNVTVYTYDALNRLTEYTDAEGYTFSFQYDAEGNMTASTDGNGNTTRYTYDRLNRAVSSVNAEGNAAVNSYDADGNIVRSVNEEGAETVYTYDAEGRVTSMADALSHVTNFEYDSRNRVTKVTDARGNATVFTYDLAGNVKTETNAKGVVTSYGYDANGNMLSMTDAAGTVRYAYDALNRVVRVIDRRGNTQSFTYDATGRITSVMDRNGNATQYVYDGNGNIIKTIDALGTVAEFSYNRNNQLVSTDLHRVDTINNVDSHEITLYEYDGRNLVTREINALGDSTVYVYDGNGNMVSKTDADGYVTQYSYTALDLVRSINYNGCKEVLYSYNKAGELVQMDDWTGTTTFELDLLGRLQKMTDHKGNTVSYTYDEVGNQTSITYPDGSKTGNSYDVVNNLIGVVDAENGTYTYVYDEANRPIKLTYPNGWVEQYTYDAEGNLLKTVDTDPFQLYNKTPKVKYEYTYDAEGNALTKFQRDSDATEGLKTRTTYTYDALNRLTGSVRRPEASAAGTLSYTYTYDSLGNLLRQTGPVQGEEDTYQYNDLNQMVSKRVCGYEQKVTRIHDYGYTYDKRGNLVKEEEICSPTTTGPKNITIATYLYDETNRMVRGTNADGEVSGYIFNGLGVRVGTELILQDNSHGYTDFHSQTPSVETDIEKPEVVKTDYVIDYTRLGVDQRVLMKSEEGGYDFRYTYGREKLKVFTTGEGSNWWGQSVKQCVNAAYVHTDLLGSVVNLSDQYGRVTARTDYADWGEVRRTTDITVNGGFRRLLPEITYATHEYDDVLNQFYAKARMYDAESKRFTAMDPVLDASQYDLRQNTNDAAQLIQYLYARNNPINLIDLLGLYYIVDNPSGEGYRAYPAKTVVTVTSSIVGLVPKVGGYLSVGINALSRLDAKGGTSEYGFAALNKFGFAEMYDAGVKKLAQKEFGKEIGAKIVDYGSYFRTVATFWKNLDDAMSIERNDEAAFNLLTLAGIEPVGDTVEEVEYIMIAAIGYATSNAWFFTDTTHQTWRKGPFGSINYTNYSSAFSNLISLQRMKNDKKSVREIQDRITSYWQPFTCGRFSRVLYPNKMLRNSIVIYRVATPPPQNGYMVSADYFYHYALNNYSSMLEWIKADFSHYMKVMMDEYPK